MLHQLQKIGSVLIALSGGVDSAVVAALAYKALGDKAIALTFESPLTLPDDIKNAKAAAKSIGIEHHIESINELELVSIANNPSERCYYCKQFRFTKAQKIAKDWGLAAVVDGTTLSDLNEHRPGLRALQKLRIISPLRDAKITKSEAREIARQLNLPNANEPPNSCLATRIPYGEPLETKRLERVAAAEQIIRQMTGLRLVRMRDHGHLVRIEVDKEELRNLVDSEITNQLVSRLHSLGYHYVTLDLDGYRFGSFDD